LQFSKPNEEGIRIESDDIKAVKVNYDFNSFRSAVPKLGIKIQLDYSFSVLLRCDFGEILLPNKISTLCQNRFYEAPLSSSFFIWQSKV
jgi:hypothetical protein